MIDGDTRRQPLGLGAFASRQAVTAGNAVHLAAAQRAREGDPRRGRDSSQRPPDDLELQDGAVQVKGVPQMRTSLGEIAGVLGGVPGFALPGNMAPGLAAAIDFQPPALAYSNGTHVCEVEVDVATGRSRITRYVVVHDCGRMINPLLVEGQVLGAIAHGIGATLYECMHYDANGQPLTANYADYLLPTTDTCRAIEIITWKRRRRPIRSA